MMNWDLLLGAAIVATPPTIASVATLVTALRNSRKVDKIQENTDGMKTELVNAALLKGHADGVKDQKIAAIEAKP